MAKSSIPDRSIRIAADRGGTFCDIWASYPDSASSTGERKEVVVKLLSVDPSNYPDAPVEGVRRVLEMATGEKFPRGEPLKTDKIEYIRLSTTVATNALLERKGEKVALVITKGFEDLLFIGNQSRPKIFDLNIQRPPQLYTEVISVDERVTLVGYSSDPKAKEHAIQWNDDGTVARGYRGKGWDGESVGEGAGRVVKGVSGEGVRILREPDLEDLRPRLQTLYDSGVRALAVVFIHSYTFPDHELLVGQLAREIGFTHVSLSSQLLPMIRAVSRGVSACADAYLTPILSQYLSGFFAGFQLPDDGQDAMKVEFMGSDGGLLSLKNFSGLKSLLSGPAGGVVGFALTAWDASALSPPPIIGLDVGGTSTDVSRYDGRFETVYETTTAGVSIQCAQLDINTVASGGGSCLGFRNGLFLVGPESAGAHPGPACYRKNGPLAITDANLFLGRLVPEYFPSCFGPNENEPLDPSRSSRAFEDIAARIKKETGWETGMDELVYGFIKVANETMCRPIRTLTEARGFDLSKHILASFGGAGGQHACEIAESLGIKRIIIHRYSSILSAYGLALSDRVHEAQEPASDVYDASTTKGLIDRLDRLEVGVREELASQGFEADKIHVERFLNIRYTGTDTALMTKQVAGSDDFGAAFEEEYRKEFGFTLENSKSVDDVRCRGTGKTYSSLPPSPLSEMSTITFTSLDPSASSKVKQCTSTYFQDAGRVDDTPIYLLGDLEVGDRLQGPAMIIDETQTIVVIPSATVHCTSTSLVIVLAEKERV